MSEYQAYQAVNYSRSESTSDLLEDSLTCPLCIELFDTNLEVVAQPPARQAHRSSTDTRKPLLSSEIRLPVSCTACWFTFCNACLHRLMYRPGGVKCPICPNADLNVAAPAINLPLVRLLSVIRPMVETPVSSIDCVNTVTPTKKKTKTSIKAKSTKAKKAIPKREDHSSFTASVAEYKILSDNVYQVQAIVGRRSSPGNKWYKVRWAGYTEEHDTWEHWQCLKHLDDAFLQQMRLLDEHAKKKRKT